MDKAPEFIILPENSYDITQTCPIQITSGQFKGIVYRYGQIGFAEVNDGLNVNMDIQIITAPEGFDKQNKEFTQAVGNIFVKIVEDDVTTDSADLEDDVHQDPVDRF